MTDLFAADAPTRRARKAPPVEIQAANDVAPVSTPETTPADAEVSSAAEVAQDGKGIALIPVQTVSPKATAITLALAGEPLSDIVLYASSDSVDAGLAELRRRAYAAAGQADATTVAGREIIRSTAYNVAKSKVAMVKAGKSLTEGWRKQVSMVNAECNRIEEEADAIRDEIRAPLDAYESAEADRIAAHDAALQAITALTVGVSAEMPSDWIKQRIVSLGELPDRQWQEFASRAASALQSTLDTLQDALKASEKREADAAELARLRAEDEARKLTERDAKIARQAAETARLEAEQEAARQAEITRKAAEAERERIENEALAAADKAAAERQKLIDDAAEAERLAKEVNDRLEREKQDLIDKAAAAEIQRIADIEAAETQRLAAERQAETDKQKAVQDERDRAAAAQETQRQEDELRAQNKAHRAEINGEVKADLIAAGLTDELAVAVITAIVKSAVRHVAIGY